VGQPLPAVPDSDGNLVNLFTPITNEARAKFGV